PCLVPPPAPSSPPFSACCLPRAPPPTDASPLSLHDALPISADRCGVRHHRGVGMGQHLPGHPGQLSGGEGRLDEGVVGEMADYQDRKSTRLNSSHVKISYAVFCLKKKKELDSHPGLREGAPR